MPSLSLPHRPLRFLRALALLALTPFAIEAAEFPEWTLAGPSGGFIYGDYNVALTGIPAGADVSRYAKIANDFAASGDAAGQMPQFQVTLERRPDAAGAWTAVPDGVKSLTEKFTDVLTGYINVRLDTLATGAFGRVYSLRFRMAGGGGGAGAPPNEERIRIGIKNNGPAARTYFGASGTTEAEAQVPRIKLLSGPVDFGEKLLGLPQSDVAAEHVLLANIGTGDLSITAFPAPGNPAFTRSAVTTPLTLAPLAPALDVEVGFNPSHASLVGSPGVKNTSIAVANNSTNSPALNVAISATAVTLEIGMVYDISGSMSWKPDGGSTSNPEETRIHRAKLAGQQIQLLLQGLEGQALRAGLFTFPQFAGACPSAFTKIPLGPLSVTGTDFSSAWGTGSNSLQADPNGGTPLAEGLRQSHGLGADNFGAGKWTQGQYVRRAIILLSDGDHTCNSTTGPATPQAWVAQLQGVNNAARKIRVFTIPYGAAGSGSINHEVLDDLAEASGGDMYSADALDFSKLSKQFRAALVDWRSDWATVSDPKGTLVKGSAAKEHSVCIDESAERISFVVDWKKMAFNSLNFTLLGPSGASVSGTPGVTFSSGQNFAMYTVKGSTARGFPGSDRWTLRLTGGSGLAGGESLEYSYEVIAKSKIKTESGFSSGFIATLDKALLYEARFTRLPPPGPTPLKVELQYELPAQSHGGYLASMEGFKPEWLLDSKRNFEYRAPPMDSMGARTERSMIASGADTLAGASRAASEFRELVMRNQYVPEKIMGEPASLLQRKVYALEILAKRPYPTETEKGTLPLFDDGTHGDRVPNDGIYSATMPAFQRDGLSRFGLFVSADTARRACFAREQHFQKFVHVLLDQAQLSKAIELRQAVALPFFPPALKAKLDEPVPDGLLRKMVQFTPKDATGNPWGPGKAQRLVFKGENVEMLGEPVDNLDGSYSLPLQYRKGTAPGLSLEIDGASAGGSLGLSIDLAADDPKNPKYPLWLIALLAILVLLIAAYAILRRKSP